MKPLNKEYENEWMAIKFSLFFMELHIKGHLFKGRKHKV